MTGKKSNPADNQADFDRLVRQLNDSSIELPEGTLSLHDIYPDGIAPESSIFYDDGRLGYEVQLPLPLLYFGQSDESSRKILNWDGDARDFMSSLIEKLSKRFQERALEIEQRLNDDWPYFAIKMKLGIGRYALITSDGYHSQNEIDPERHQLLSKNGIDEDRPYCWLRLRLQVASESFAAFEHIDHTADESTIFSEIILRTRRAFEVQPLAFMGADAPQSASTPLLESIAQCNSYILASMMIYCRDNDRVDTTGYMHFNFEYFSGFWPSKTAIGYQQKMTTQPQQPAPIQCFIQAMLYTSSPDQDEQDAFVTSLSEEADEHLERHQWHSRVMLHVSELSCHLWSEIWTNRTIAGELMLYRN